jgi:hypothetical protein
MLNWYTDFIRFRKKQRFFVDVHLEFWGYAVRRGGETRGLPLKPHLVINANRVVPAKKEIG